MDLLLPEYKKDYPECKSNEVEMSDWPESSSSMTDDNEKSLQKHMTTSKQPALCTLSEKQMLAVIFLDI